MHSVVGRCCMYGEPVGVPIDTISGCHMPKIIHFAYLSAFLLATWHREHVLTTSGMYCGLDERVHTCREQGCTCVCACVCHQMRPGRQNTPAKPHRTVSLYIK